MDIVFLILDDYSGAFIGIIMSVLCIRLESACLSLKVKLSVLCCLRFSLDNSHLILCRIVSNLLLSVGIDLYDLGL